MSKNKNREVIKIEFYDFMLSEIRQRRVRIEADTVEEAMSIAEELWEEKHSLMSLTESDVVMTRLCKYAGDFEHLLKISERRDAPIRIVSLEPERDARICCVDISLDMLDPNRTSIVILDDDIVCIFGSKGASVNRMIADKTGRRQIIYGAAMICKTESSGITGLTAEEAEEYREKYSSPGQIIAFDEYIFRAPREEKNTLKGEKRRDS